MIFTETALAGAYILDLDRREDDRGYFARMFCQDEFAEHGLEPVIAQANVAMNRRRGTLRGMHFQFPPKAETKYVRCTRGAILDVIVDLRPESPTYLSHVAVELTAEIGRGLYVPRRFAHGYQVLADTTETTYMVGVRYAPNDEFGLRFDDPRLGISWPLSVTEMSPKDAAQGAARQRRGADLIADELRRMILVDSALAAREADGRPIRVGMVGAGFMGQGLRPAILYLVAVMIVGTALALRLAAPVPGDAPYSSLSIARGSPGDGRIAVEVVNREGTTVLYRLQLELDGRLIGSETSALPDGGRWDYIPHTIVAPGQRVEVQLFRSPNLMTLYRDVNATVGPDW